MRFIRNFFSLIAAILALSDVHAQDTASKVFSDYYINAVVWQQSSGEYRALAFQAYNIARMQLDMALKNRKARAKPLAVIVDIDETILNNSPFEADMIHKGQYNEQDWNKWVTAAQADTIPGSYSFLKYAASENVAVFYITNRKDDSYKSTLTNLKKYGFPFVDTIHVFTNNSSNKEPLRQRIMDRYDVVLLCGDNLNDFTGIFYHKNVADRNSEVNQLSNEFGKKFIVLPNPMYGDWQEALFNYNHNLTDKEKQKINYNAIK